MYQTISPGLVGVSIGLEEGCRMAAAAGFEGYAIEPFMMEQGAGAVRDVLAQYHFTPACYGLPVDFRREESVFEETLRALEPSAKFCAELGMTRFCTWLSPASDDLTYEENFQLHTRRLKACAEVLREYGIMLGLEFVGTPSAAASRKHAFIHNLDGLLDLWDAIGTGNVGIMIDSWHWDMAQQKLEDFRKIPDEKYVVVAHINDAPDLPLEEQQDGSRRLPGATGVLRIGDFFTGLTQLGYQGPVMAEPFDRSLNGLPAETVFARVKSSIDSVWPRL